MSTFTWATVTAVSPLRVRLDGDAAEIPFTPDSLVDPLALAVSDRVRCELSNNRLIVLGKTGGTVSAALIEAIAQATPVATIKAMARRDVPAGWLRADGAAVSRASYPDLFVLLNPVISTFTVTLASPGVFTTPAAHNLGGGQMVYLTSTGALPTGLAQNLAYYATAVTTTTFRLSTSLANALAGVYINTSGSQSGVHTVRATYGVGNGSTTFNVPSLGGRTIVGWDPADTNFNAFGKTGGLADVTLTLAQTPMHWHRVGADGSADGTIDAQLVQEPSPPTHGGWAIALAGTSGGARALVSDRQGGGGSHTNLQPYNALPYFIKT